MSSTTPDVQRPASALFRKESYSSNSSLKLTYKEKTPMKVSRFYARSPSNESMQIKF
jgi:hypothetical protein